MRCTRTVAVSTAFRRGRGRRGAADETATSHRLADHSTVSVVGEFSQAMPCRRRSRHATAWTHIRRHGHSSVSDMPFDGPGAPSTLRPGIGRRRSRGGRALITWGRCAGRVPWSASHKRKQLRTSRTIGAIARTSREAAASPAGARVRDAMAVIRARRQQPQRRTYISSVRAYTRRLPSSAVGRGRT